MTIYYLDLGTVEEGRETKDFHAWLTHLGAKQLLKHSWAFEAKQDVGTLAKAAAYYLGETSSFALFEILPKAAFAAVEVDKAGGEWLAQQIDRTPES